MKALVQVRIPWDRMALCLLPAPSWPALPLPLCVTLHIEHWILYGMIHTAHYTLHSAPLCTMVPHIEFYTEWFSLFSQVDPPSSLCHVFIPPHIAQHTLHIHSIVCCTLYKLHIAHIVYCVVYCTNYTLYIGYILSSMPCNFKHCLHSTLLIYRRNTQAWHTHFHTLQSTSEQQCVEMPGRLSNQLPKIKERIKIASDDTEFEKYQEVWEGTKIFFGSLSVNQYQKSLWQYYQSDFPLMCCHNAQQPSPSWSIKEDQAPKSTKKDHYRIKAPVWSFSDVLWHFPTPSWPRTSLKEEPRKSKKVPST